ncbi:class I SAM-dependent methyltransferase [Kribbella shirazensis]|uniref:Ubiquinone/menaquinone biosynthesis C-methylase UbiE n=1 Tax=Kribbella shirazensis TaxID=1105143 RepID=A0A7X6A3C9_9ACTN|nr:class I SAM-dependent methyltransferase [Kribbella shirazensis]NIK59765.1 ubiquinone/menaquinone biosynthesis C-methylase UbiE [Kribbella shirazensis]
MKRPLFARMYARVRPALDQQGAAEHRRRLLAGAVGRVVEVGAGDGGNFAHYPSEVVSVLAVEPEPYLRAQAEHQARSAPVPVEVVEGTADKLPAPDAAADVVVVSLVLCSVPDQAAALAEARRVLRPGGELRFYEHVAADGGRLGTVQRVVDATLWPLLAGGCHTHRDTVGAIAAAGFEVEELDRFEFPPGRSTPASPHVLGRARLRA